MRAILALALILATLSTTACAEMTDYPSAIWRYKLTVEVTTPEGLKSGSSVREISAISRPEMLAEGNDTNYALSKGEALIVDLGQRGQLFALLSGPTAGANHAIWMLLKAFPSPCVEGPVSRCGINYYSSLENGKTSIVQPDNYPTFVKFKNLAEPLTVEVLSKYSDKSMSDGYGREAKSLTNAFGDGVSISSIKLEIVDSVPVDNLAQILPWLKDIGEGYLHGGKTARGAPYGLNGINFKAGDKYTRKSSTK